MLKSFRRGLRGLRKPRPKGLGIAGLTLLVLLVFPFRFNGAGRADVMESGVYKGGDTPYAAEDVFRVAIRG